MSETKDGALRCRLMLAPPWTKDDSCLMTSTNHSAAQDCSPNVDWKPCVVSMPIDMVISSNAISGVAGLLCYKLS